MRVVGTVEDGYILMPVTQDLAAAVDAGRAAGFSPLLARPAARTERVRESDGDLAPTSSVNCSSRLAPPRHAGEVWDLDNLVMPTIDALEAVSAAGQADTPTGNRTTNASTGSGRRWTDDDLQVRPVRVEDPATLGRIEEAVLLRLDPPLNLRGMPATATLIFGCCCEPR